MEIEDYSPKWLLERILKCGNNHGAALMYINQFQREIVKNNGLGMV